MYWCCAQVEPRRERLASHCLGLAGYEIYQPLLREQRRGSHGRKITVTPPLSPGYLFLWVVSGWWNARWAAGVRRLVMDGLVPARVPDRVIAEIRSRERSGLIELSKLRLGPGARAGFAWSATRSDWVARCFASARTRARIAATAWRAATGRIGKERDRGG
jgi:hypothetical protein